MTETRKEDKKSCFCITVIIKKVVKNFIARGDKRAITDAPVSTMLHFPQMVVEFVDVVSLKLL